MKPRIEISEEKKLVGKHLTLSLTNYRVVELWKSFLQRRKEITNNLNSDLIGLTIYKPAHFRDFNPHNEFEKWATVEVSGFDNVPNEMNTFVLESGLYAVFNYKGLSNDNSIFKYILSEWLPSSEYVLDDKPHFEVLGEKYKNNDPNSEEEIWIPIKTKK